MSNVFNDHARLWILDTDNILTFNNRLTSGKADQSSGLRGIRIRKIVLVPNGTGDGVSFTTIMPNATPTLSLISDTFSVTNTSKISDDAGTALDDSKCTVGNWLHLYASETGNNEGWWYISANDSNDIFVDVENDNHVLTNEDNKRYNIDIYTPETCEVLVSATGDTANEPIMSEVQDWGVKGRFYQNLAMFGLSGSATVYIYVL